MNGVDVLCAFRVLVKEAALMERTLATEPVPGGFTNDERRVTTVKIEKDRERMNAQLASIGERIAALRKPFDAAVMRSRSSTERHIARLYYGLGMTDAEAADRIGLSVNTVTKYRLNFVKQLSKMGDV